MLTRISIYFMTLIIVLTTLTQRAIAKDELTLILDWFVNPDHAPLIIAQEKGYFSNLGLKVNLINRLSLDNNKIDLIIRSINSISKLKDPTNITLDKWKSPNGLLIKRDRTNKYTKKHIKGNNGENNTEYTLE